MVISWSPRSPCARNTSESKLCISTEVKYLFCFWSGSTLVIKLSYGTWVLEVSKLQDCWNKTLITCFFSTLNSMYFLCLSMELCWMLSCIAVHIPQSTVSTAPMLSSTHMLCEGLAFGSSDNNFCSSKIVFFSSESFCRLKIFTRWQRECSSSCLRDSPGKWIARIQCCFIV